MIQKLRNMLQSRRSIPAPMSNCCELQLLLLSALLAGWFAIPSGKHSIPYAPPVSLVNAERLFLCCLFLELVLSLRGMSSELQTHAQLRDVSHECSESYSLHRVRAQAESSILSAKLLRCNCAPHVERLFVLL